MAMLKHSNALKYLNYMHEKEKIRSVDSLMSISSEYSLVWEKVSSGKALKNHLVIFTAQNIFQWNFYENFPTQVSLYGSY